MIEKIFKSKIHFVLSQRLYRQNITLRSRNISPLLQQPRRPWTRLLWSVSWHRQPQRVKLDNGQLTEQPVGQWRDQTAGEVPEGIQTKKISYLFGTFTKQTKHIIQFLPLLSELTKHEKYAASTNIILYASIYTFYSAYLRYSSFCIFTASNHDSDRKQRLIVR